MARQRGTSGRQVGSDGGSGAVGPMGEPGAGAEGEQEVEAEAEGEQEAEAEAEGVPLPIPTLIIVACSFFVVG